MFDGFLQVLSRILFSLCDSSSS